MKAGGEEGKAQVKEAIGDFISAASKNPAYAEVFAGVDAGLSRDNPAPGQMLDSARMCIFLARNPDVAEALKRGNPKLGEPVDSAVQRGWEKLTQRLENPRNGNVAGKKTLAEKSAVAQQHLQKAISSKLQRFGANHAAKTEVLKFVRGAAGDPVKLHALSQLAQSSPKYSSLIASALGSAMGGASWIRGAGDAIALSKNAMTAFLYLGRSGALSPSDQQEVVAKLGDGKLSNGKSVSATHALTNPQSPFWQATQELSLAQRTELADAIENSPDFQAKKDRCNDLASALNRSVTSPPLASLNDGLKTFDEHWDLRETGFETPSTPEHLKMDPAKFAKLKQDWKGDESAAQKTVDTARGWVKSALADSGARRELNKCRTMSGELKQLKGELSSLRASIMTAHCGATSSDALDASMGANLAFKAAGISSYAGFVDVCREKGERQHSVSDHVSSAMNMPRNAADKLSSLARCAEEVEGICQWAKPIEIAEQKLNDIRPSLGIQGADIPPEEKFAPGGPMALQFGQSNIKTLLLEAIECSLLSVPEENRAQIREEIQKMGMMPPMDYVKLLGRVQQNPSQYNLGADFQLPDSVLQIMEGAKKIDSYA
ncbi:MAG: hypothetical protein LBT57_03245 [Puniceicoccales bacterium]|jgi:hypothetical protein|nr:hypothetical protein [Puniceicoccales bacterium]